MEIEQEMIIIHQILQMLQRKMVMAKGIFLEHVVIHKQDGHLKVMDSVEVLQLVVPTIMKVLVEENSTGMIMDLEVMEV